MSREKQEATKSVKAQQGSHYKQEASPASPVVSDAAIFLTAPPLPTLCHLTNGFLEAPKEREEIPEFRKAKSSVRESQSAELDEFQHATRL
jgi:hypothetical protein